MLLSDRYLFRVPNPGAISFLAIAFSAYLGGITSGLISAAISFGLAAVLLSAPGTLFLYTPDNVARLVVLAVCTPAVALIIGALQIRAKRAVDHERIDLQGAQVAARGARPIRRRRGAARLRDARAIHQPRVPPSLALARRTRRPQAGVRRADVSRTQRQDVQRARRTRSISSRSRPRASSPGTNCRPTSGSQTARSSAAAARCSPTAGAW